jgi:hypothetical protein
MLSTMSDRRIVSNAAREAQMRIIMVTRLTRFVSELLQERERAVNELEWALRQATRTGAENVRNS